MPGAAAALDAVTTELPLPEIATAICVGVSRLVDGAAR
jgi:hypothetical protein